MIAGLQLLTTYTDTHQFLDSVTAAADEHREQFGFLPASAYEDQARLGKLWIATSAGEYAGHLLLGGQFPSIRIFQAFANPLFRRQGVGRFLIGELKTFAAAKGYISISAKVAKDLDRANDFWSSMGFRAVIQRRGGATTGRQIIVREFLIPENSLFAVVPKKEDVESHFSKARNPFVGSTPMFALDLNVIFDLINNRPRAEESAAVVRQAMTGSIRLFVTAEFQKELSRHTKSHAADPFLDFAKSLPALPEVEEVHLQKLISELRSIVFPERKLDGSKEVNDASDLVHLASAVHHGLTGFITSEKRILQEAQTLQAAKSLTVVSPSDFIADPEKVAPVQTWQPANGSAFEIRELKEKHRQPCTIFLQERGYATPEVNTLLVPGTTQEPRSRYCLWALMRLMASRPGLACFQLSRSSKHILSSMKRTEGPDNSLIVCLNPYLGLLRRLSDERSFCVLALIRQ